MDDLSNFTDILDEIPDSQQSQPMSLPSTNEFDVERNVENVFETAAKRPPKGTGQYERFRSIEEIDPKYREVFSYPYFNLVQSCVIEDALYSDKSMVVCAPTGSGKTVIFEMAIIQLLMYLEDKNYTDDFKIIYMAPVKALCTERLSEWYPKFTKLGLLCIVVTGDTDVDFSQLKPYRIIITTPEKWDMLTRRWRDHRSLVEVIKLFLIDEVHILNDESRGPALEVVVSRMKTIESSAQSAYRIEQLQKKYQGDGLVSDKPPPRIRFVAVSATVSNPEDVASWIGDSDNSAVFYKFGDECRPVKLRRVVEGYPCSEGTSIFKFDIILNYKLWPIIQKYHNGKPTLIFCNTRKSVVLTAEMLSREITINFNPDQKAQLVALASTLKNKKLQSLILSGVGCHHAGLLYEERTNIERAFRNRDLPILITTTTLAMGVNLPAHLVIIKNTQQYVNGAYQEYSISTVLQMVGRAGRPQYDTEATAVIMTRLADKHRYQALVGGSEPLQSYLHKRLPENLNSEAALRTVTDVAQCVQWLRSTFLWVRARRDPKRYLGLPATASQELITKKIEELCVKAMNGLASTGLITMDEASCIESTEAGRLMSIYYIDLETMKHIMKIEGNETLERLLCIVCESHEFTDTHLRVDERRCLNALNRNNTATTIRFPMKGKITTRQMKVNCIIQAILGCLPIPDPSLNQEAMKVMRMADRICKCLVAYVTRSDLISQEPKSFSAVLNSLLLAKCISSQLWEDSPFLSRQLKGIGPAFSALLASAGKISFSLLRESHPRDLERIMNKGPPAGNVLLKQVCLLPKYVLIATADDNKTVSIQLVLQNQSHLAESSDHLTAGDAHKCYVLVGDSENHILLLTSFKDKDLINIYLGNINYKITRKHDFEHTIYAYCISSNFVGIDEHCEHVFKDLHRTLSRPREDTAIKNTNNKQPLITDSFNERKRKNQNNITEPKPKKMRESTVIQKYKSLKDSFSVSSKKLNKNPNVPSEISDKTLRDTLCCDKDISAPVVMNSRQIVNNKSNTSLTETYKEGNETDQFVDDHKIDCLLNEIESEILKHQNSSATSDISLKSPKNYNQYKKVTPQNTLSSDCKNKSEKINSQFTKQLLQHKHKKQKVAKNQRQSNIKNNYNFIDLLERNVSYSEDEENIHSDNDIGFCKTIKSGLDHFFLKTKCNSIDSDIIVSKLLEASEDNAIPGTRTREWTYEDSNTNADNIYEEKVKNTYHINNDITQKVDRNNIKIDKTGADKEKQTLIPENISCDVNLLRNLYNEENVLKPCNTPDISSRKHENEHNNMNNKILCMTQELHQTECLNKSDISYNRDTGIVSPKKSRKADTEQNTKELTLLDKNIDSVNWIEKSNNQSNKTVETIQSDPIKNIKQYTCTSTKIDVCSKRDNNQMIHVVRKVRMNLVTEALYISNNWNRTQINYTEKDITVIPKSKPIEDKNKLQNISDSIFASSNAVHKIDKISNAKHCAIGFNIRNNLHYPPKSTDHVGLSNKDQNLSDNKDENIRPDQNKISNIESGVKTTYNATLHTIPIERLQNDFNVIDLEDVAQNNQSFNRKIAECENVCAIEKQQTLPESNKISDILEKYRILFQNDHKERDVGKKDLTKNMNTIKDNVIETKKTNKPFNILDIDNEKIRLPNIFADIIPTQTILLPELAVKDLNQREEMCITEDQPLPTATDLNEESLNFNIDQLMFDPKTLLSYLNDENSDIIPPPPEYRDKSIKNTPEDDYIKTIHFNEYNQDILDSSQSQIENIIDSDHMTDTPENIESWVLSREESQEDYKNLTIRDNIMPYTVNNSINPKNNWINQNKSLRHTLQQFKFNHKEKMNRNN